MVDMFFSIQPPAEVLSERENYEKGEAPIGVFDSGVGGLTILSALRKELPCENYMYFGDTAHCPYGTRSDVEITELSLRACRFLIEQGAKLMVVACNTVSLIALTALRSAFSIPIVGVVPAVKVAAGITRTGRIGIAATNQAARAAYLGQLIQEFADGLQAFAIGCPELVTLVERGELGGLEVDITVKRALEPLLREEVDVIVLGCTHFPALRPAIERVAGHQVKVIDSAFAVAQRTRSLLDSKTLARPLKPGHSTGGLQLWCSGDPARFSEVASKLLGYPVLAHQAEAEKEPTSTL